MSSPRPVSDLDRPKDVSVPALTNFKKDGTPYVRFEDVEDEIRRSLETAPGTWTADLKSETLVHLLRLSGVQQDSQLVGRLVKWLGRRVATIATDFAEGIDPVDAEELVMKVGEEIIELVFAHIPSRQSEFLEIAFRHTVKRRTLNHVEKYKNQPQRQRFPTPPAGVNGPTSETNDPIQALEDNRPSPVDLIVQAEEAALTPGLIRAGLKAITDARHREAIILHFLQGWPITDKDPQKATLCTHFRKSDRQIRTWIQRALAEMRKAMGEKP